MVVYKEPKISSALKKKHLILFNKLVREQTIKGVSKMKKDEVDKVFKKYFGWSRQSGKYVLDQAYWPLVGGDMQIELRDAKLQKYPLEEIKPKSQTEPKKSEAKPKAKPKAESKAKAEPKKSEAKPKPKPKPKEKSDLEKLKEEMNKVDTKLSQVKNKLLTLKELKKRFKEPQQAINYLKSLAEQYNNNVVSTNKVLKKIISDKKIPAQQFNDETRDFRILQQQIPRAINSRLKAIRNKW